MTLIQRSLPGDYHKKMWKDIMERVHKKKNLEYQKFKKPEDIVSCQICTKSGLLASMDTCPHAEDGSYIRTEYFARGTQPQKKCNLHVNYAPTS